MLQSIESGDAECLEKVIEEAVRISIAESEEDALFLIEDIVNSLKDWERSGMGGFHRKTIIEGNLVAFIVVEDFWNLSHLSPCHQRSGIGRELVDAAIETCRGKSPRGKIQLYSSDATAGFYLSYGFTVTGDRIERPGVCIPMEYRF